MAPSSLTDFKVLSFDCYGTLVDWESGIFKHLRPLLDRFPENHPFQTQSTVVAHLDRLQTQFRRAQPNMLYDKMLSLCYETIAAEAGVNISDTEAHEFGRSVGQWEAFPDTVAGLQQLQKHYKLIILSNVDNVNIQNTIAGPLAGIKFDAVLTAEDIGSYKPDHANFHALFAAVRDRLHLQREDLLHVAKSLPVDHVPAKELGLPSAWIARGDNGTSAMGGRLDDLVNKVDFQWRFDSIGQMASEADRAFATG